MHDKQNKIHLRITFDIVAQNEQNSSIQASIDLWKYFKHVNSFSVGETLFSSITPIHDVVERIEKVKK